MKFERLHGYKELKAQPKPRRIRVCVVTKDTIIPVTFWLQTGYAVPFYLWDCLFCSPLIVSRDPDSLFYVAGRRTRENRGYCTPYPLI